MPKEADQSTLTGEVEGTLAESNRLMRVMMATRRAVLVWLALLALAFANGAIRELVFIPSLGDVPAHAVSVVMLSLAIAAVSWSTISWMQPRSLAEAWRIGVLWLALTLAFELLAGHYLFGAPWRRLLADYNILRGRIWILVLMTTVSAPVIAARVRGLARA